MLGKVTHHSPKEILTRDKVIDDRDANAFLDLIDDLRDGDRLTEGQWKKFYAIVRNQANISGHNYTTYKRKDGATFDVTCNTAVGVNLFEYAADRIDEEEGPLEACKRLKTEISDIDAKIANLQQKRVKVYERYLETKTKVLEAV